MCRIMSTIGENIPGIYVPSLYEVKYQPDGTVKSIAPTVAEARPSIRRRMVTKLPSAMAVPPLGLPPPMLASTRRFDYRLKPTPKIIDIVKTTSPHTFLVGFRAQHELSNDELIQSAYKRLKKANADLIVANDIGRDTVGFDHDSNEIFIVDASKEVVHVPLTSKKEAARKLFDIIVDKFMRHSKTQTHT